MPWQTIGFEKIKRFFETAVDQGRLSHAYLFSGPEMIGKKTLALEFAGGPGPDVKIVDPARSGSGQTIGIDQIRDLKSFISLSPYLGEQKFAIINDAHLMTEESQNALLKVLEEPSPSSLLILVTASPDSLLPTVISRCQEIKFSTHPQAVVARFLENRRLPADQSNFLTGFAGGRLGLVKNAVENGLFLEIEHSVKDLVALARADLEERFAFAQKMSDDKRRAEMIREVFYWLLYAKTRLASPASFRLARSLLSLHQNVNQPQYNHRLALENFLLNL